MAEILKSVKGEVNLLKNITNNNFWNLWCKNSFIEENSWNICENIQRTSDANEKSINLTVQSLTGKQDNVKHDFISYFAVNCLTITDINNNDHKYWLLLKYPVDRLR